MDVELSLVDTFQKLGIALGLGLLVGLQRERTDPKIAGIRTFPLITVFGTITGFLVLRFGGWVFIASLLGLITIIGIADLGTKMNFKKDPGITTEISILLMFGLGNYLVIGYTAVAIVTAGTLVVLLHLKPEMHSFARHIGDKDFKAIIQFVLITLVILPVLPNQAYDPFQVLNPFKIWLMVVLIVGISLGGYVVYKFMDSRRGSIMSGLLGGLISSTATTVSYARRTREIPEAASMSALVIMIASTIVFVRVLIVVAVIAPNLFLALVGPLGAMLIILAAIAISAGFFHSGPAQGMLNHENPTELKSAIFFMIIFVMVLFGAALANKYFGSQGLYGVAVLSGLTDMDAITLSSLEMLKNGQVQTGMTWRMILVASMANLVFKGATVAILGNRQLFKRVSIMFSLAFAGGFLILLFWPA